jgi:hypothetical protein
MRQLLVGIVAQTSCLQARMPALPHPSLTHYEACGPVIQKESFLAPGIHFGLKKIPYCHPGRNFSRTGHSLQRLKGFLRNDNVREAQVFFKLSSWKELL